MRSQATVQLTASQVHPLVPANVTEAFRLAEIIHTSGMAPTALKTPEAVMVCILRGLEIGLPPMAALQHSFVIGGKPNLDGDAMLALVTASGLLADLQETISGEGDTMTAHCRAVRVDGRQKEWSFSLKEAKAAGLHGDNWKKYPKRMLRYRALSYVLRDLFPDVLLGLSPAEEWAVAEPCRDLTPVEVDTETGEVIEAPATDGHRVERAPDVVELRRKIRVVVTRLAPGRDAAARNRCADLVFSAAARCEITVPKREDEMPDLEAVQSPEDLARLAEELEGVAATPREDKEEDQ